MQKQLTEEIVYFILESEITIKETE